ncbi:hypothetical protein TGVAND_251860 [Toxoplasma gondii VAND]|nr:hypothetical protein TGVAND_251860 [Toxoplasma gondii VAND]
MLHIGVSTDSTRNVSQVGQQASKRWLAPPSTLSHPCGCNFALEKPRKNIKTVSFQKFLPGQSIPPDEMRNFNMAWDTEIHTEERSKLAEPMYTKATIGKRSAPFFLQTPFLRSVCLQLCSFSVRKWYKRGSDMFIMSRQAKPIEQGGTVSVGCSDNACDAPQVHTHPRSDTNCATPVQV